MQRSVSRYAVRVRDHALERPTSPHKRRMAAIWILTHLALRPGSSAGSSCWISSGSLVPLFLPRRPYLAYATGASCLRPVGSLGPGREWRAACDLAGPILCPARSGDNTPSRNRFQLIAPAPTQSGGTERVGLRTNRRGFGFPESLKPDTRCQKRNWQLTGYPLSARRGLEPSAGISVHIRGRQRNRSTPLPPMTSARLETFRHEALEGL